MSENICPRKFLIVADPGIDDAQAIILALSSADIEIISLHVQCGNTTRYNAAKNALRLLHACGRTEIPVYQGSACALVLQLEKGDDYFGSDGFGDSPDPNAPTIDKLQEDHSVNAMINAVRTYPGEITLVALGPLTDLALAHRLDPNFSKNLKSCFIMGGNYHGKGNITNAAEFNTFFDPESCHIVLSEYQCPISLFPWELCVDSGMSWDVYDDLRKKCSTKARFMGALESKLISKWKSNGAYIICDELAMAGAIDESVVAAYKNVSIKVELHGKMTRGQLVVDWQNRNENASKIKLITKLNMDKIIKMLDKAYEG
ncbi:inosine-uridine preferring nucleoside hydrolase-like [Argonauta hians]